MFTTLYSVAYSALSISVVSSTAFQPQSKNPPPSSLEPPKASAVANTNLLDLVGLNANISCEGLYGRNLNVDSCNNALDKIPQDSTSLNFGVRGRGNWNVLLPARYLSDDGLCAIDISMRWNPPQDQDVSTYTEIYLAADSLINTCVRNPARNTGGAVWNLGIAKALEVEIWQQTPAVTCVATKPAYAPFYDSCKEIIDKMPWSEAVMYFGKGDLPLVQVPVPKVLVSTDRECKMVVFNIGGASWPVDQTSWAYIWQAAVTINEMCVKESKTGTSVVRSRVGNTRVAFGKRGSPGLDILSGLNMTASDLSIVSGPNMTLPITNA